MSPGEVWQYLSKPQVVFYVLEASPPLGNGMQLLRFLYLSFDEAPERVGRVFEKHLKADAHRRVA